MQIPNSLKQSKLINTTTLLALAATLIFTACSPKPSAEETAAQTKAIVEKAAADAKAELLAQQAAEKAAENAKQDAVLAAVAEEKAKQEAMAAAVKKEVHTQQRAAVREKVASKPAICANCGVVSAVNIIEAKGKGTGAGVVAGGVIGGLIGNQLAKHSDNQKAATAVGVVGGALVGNQVEKTVRKTTTYDIVVQMDNGTTQTVNQATDPVLTVGQKVKVENGVVVKN